MRHSRSRRRETARDQAAAYADFARNNWAVAAYGVGTGVEEDIPLLVDPGSDNNMFVTLGGVHQMVTQNDYVLDYDAGDPIIRITVPMGVPYEVLVSNAIPVGVPSDGSITTPKLANDAVTAAKISAADAAAILAKIGAAAAGVAITNAQMPTGSVVDSGFSSYAVSAALTEVIPRDDTIPQIGEGTEILSVIITPKSAANKLRCRFQGQFSRSALGSSIFAIFASGTGISGTPASARSVECLTAATADHAYKTTLEVELIPGTTNPVTISVNAGPDASAGHMRMNGTSAGRLMGGASVSTLVVEEIKA